MKENMFSINRKEKHGSLLFSVLSIFWFLIRNLCDGHLNGIVSRLWETPISSILVSKEKRTKNGLGVAYSTYKESGANPPAWAWSWESWSDIECPSE